MTDVIIAVIPAPGHEALTADGSLGERPALLLRDLGEWRTIDRAAHAPHLYNDEDVALVLFAPGGPRLGMVRAMEAAGINLVSTHLTAAGDGAASDDGRNWYDVRVPPWAGCGRLLESNKSYVVAHLLHQRGPVSGVLVLPVPA